MATYEGKWRCARCANANFGRNLNCLTCGVKRGEDIEFFLDDEAIVVDENLLRQGSAGADWICDYCAGSNRANEGGCSSCGNGRDGADKRLQEETRADGDWSEATNRAARLAARRQNFQTVQPKKSFFSRRFVRCGLLGAGLLAPVIIALFAALFYISTLSYPVEIEVTNLKWRRSIAVEEYRTVSETAWEGELPQGARVQSQARDLYRTDKVESGTRDVAENYSEQVADGSERYVCGRENKKNGFFEDKYCTRAKYKTVQKTRNRIGTFYKDVPVYKIRYTYAIEKWIPAGEKIASGTDFNPRWADFKADNIKTREAGRSESYELLGKESGGENKLYELKLAPENWSKFHAGERLHGKTNFFGKLVTIDEVPNADW